VRSEAGSIDAGRAGAALFDAVQAFVNVATAQLPDQFQGEGRAVVLLQQHPTIARLVVVTPGARPWEAANAIEPGLPGAAAIAEALEAFIAGGLSGLPEPVAAQALAVAAAPGSGFVVVLDPVTASARCVVVEKGADLSAGVELFSIGRAATPGWAH